jgi:hypothetical protein
MDEYFRASITQLIARAQHLRGIIPSASVLPADFHPLLLICSEEVNKIVAALRELLVRTKLKSPEEQRVLLRKYQRLAEELDLIENSAVAALTRIRHDDVALNRIVKEIASEIAYPLVPPAATCLSTGYFFVQIRLRLIFVPLAESHFLLHLADLYHEMAHLLLVEENDPKVAPIQERLGAVVGEILEQLNEDSIVNNASRAPKAYGQYFATWQYCWARSWGVEFFCDLFATCALGPAFAWSHLHLSAVMGQNPFQLALTAPITHPSDCSRMEAMLSVLSKTGFEKEAAQVEERWTELLETSSYRNTTEHSRCFSTKVINKLADETIKAYEEIGCRFRRDTIGGRIGDLLNSAWESFWKDPDLYSTWERQAIEDLRNTVPAVA